jgi:hypothetical protein
MNARKERKRGVSLSKEGVNIVRKTQSLQGWSQDIWAAKAYLSISTIKRFVNGTKIDRSSFDAACTALDLDPNALMLIPNKRLDSNTPPIPQEVLSSLVPLPPEQSPAQHSHPLDQSFMITGIFSPNKLEEIEAALAHLEALLGNDCTFTLMPDKNCLAVSGKFSANKEVLVKAALMHLRRLLLEHCITPKWME